MEIVPLIENDGSFDLSVFGIGCDWNLKFLLFSFLFSFFFFSRVENLIGYYLIDRRNVNLSPMFRTDFACNNVLLLTNVYSFVYL